MAFGGKLGKVSPIKVAAPKKRPANVRAFPKSSTPMPQPHARQRIYTKDVIRRDPLDFANIGFGDTGNTGGIGFDLGRKR